MRRLVILVLGALLAALPVNPAAAQSKVKVGVLKLTSSAPIFIGVEKGFFKEFGIEPELVYFQAAQPIATALAAGQLDVGATGLTAALYNIVLGGEQLWIVADKGREWPGYPLTGIVVQNELWDSGAIRSVKDLKGKRIGITTLGSTFHFHLGNILEKAGLKLADVRVCRSKPCRPPSRRSRASRWTRSSCLSPSRVWRSRRASAGSSSGPAICTRGRSPPSFTPRDSRPTAGARSIS